MTASAHGLKTIATIATALTVLLGSTAALAAGRVQWESTHIEEDADDEEWELRLKIYLPRAPDIAHVPMRFSFEPVMYYERALVDDHDEPIRRKVPLRHQKPIVESVDVGFLDPGSGNILKRTKFRFSVTRGHGFEAGEYKVTVTNSRTGREVGYTRKLYFEGENEVVDRRSVVFGGEKDDDKAKEDEGADEAASSEPEEHERELTPQDDAFWEGGPVEEEEPQGPPAVEEKPGGCGCRIEGTTGPGGAALLAIPGLIGALGARRRRRLRARTR